MAVATCNAMQVEHTAEVSTGNTQALSMLRGGLIVDLVAGGAPQSREVRIWKMVDR